MEGDIVSIYLEDSRMWCRLFFYKSSVQHTKLFLAEHIIFFKAVTSENKMNKKLDISDIASNFETHTV